MVAGHLFGEVNWAGCYGGVVTSTVQSWAREFIESKSLAYKLAPPAPPEIKVETARDVEALDLRPGRPPELEEIAKAPGLRGKHRSTRARAKAAHTFLHHELQAAELMCWCLLRFPETPLSFKQGLVRIALDEVRHMNMYREYIEELGFEVGAFGVRDWFWDRVPQCQSPSMFVATMGLGFEGANLDHAERFARMFEEAGDEGGAALQRHVAKEEIGHVRFAAHWFSQWNDGLSFETWSAALPKPLSPMVMKGDPINHEARQRAGLSSGYCVELQRWKPS